ncbi:POTRA domain-containing protein, FtsQ-type [Seinonella peptonophila]|uniref:POTRA domain-containing protein, FtsQ-type n=1 Tax=Seinonella peptonophila TaxID=112248 RepID=A0A1M4UZL7_9BACL|nr:FtsQ-type POTRA domain-containing protein [Seinonella peptonophila]SHE62077.1 POTRA domain-containing protein, FtsQ-type [Seinonella peptonophila]
MVERIPSLRTKVGSNRSPSPLVFLFIFLFLAGILLTLFMRSPLSKVSQIHIQGNRLLTKQQILQQANLQRDSFFFDLDRESIRSSLLKRPEIADVKVDRRFPNRLYIFLHEYPVVAYLSYQQRFAIPVLSNGVLLGNHACPIQVATRPLIESDAWDERIFLAIKGLASVPVTLRKQFLTIDQVSGQPDQVMIRSQYHHRIYIRASEIKQKLPLYLSFRNHPPGTLYLLRSFWFHSDTGLSDG